MQAKIKNLIKENRGFILFVVLMVLFRSAVADWNDVPTGSMQPTIQIGDRILVDKLAYDVRIPFTHVSLLELDDPARGDIIVFDSRVSNKRLVKRVIGIPGDVVAMRNNELIINDEPVSYSRPSSSGRTSEKVEHLPGAMYAVRNTVRSKGASEYANFDPVTVPDEHYLVLGDNRDNSADSRVIGFVPRHEVVGRSSRVVVSLDYDNYFMPRGERFWKPLD